MFEGCGVLCERIRAFVTRLCEHGAKASRVRVWYAAAGGSSRPGWVCASSAPRLCVVRACARGLCEVVRRAAWAAARVRCVTAGILLPEFDTGKSSGIKPNMYNIISYQFYYYMFCFYN